MLTAADVAAYLKRAAETPVDPAQPNNMVAVSRALAENTLTQAPTQTEALCFWALLIAFAAVKAGATKEEIVEAVAQAYGFAASVGPAPSADATTAQPAPASPAPTAAVPAPPSRYRRRPHRE